MIKIIFFVVFPDMYGCEYVACFSDFCFGPVAKRVEPSQDPKAKRTFRGRGDQGVVGVVSRSLLANGFVGSHQQALTGCARGIRRHPRYRGTFQGWSNRRDIRIGRYLQMIGSARRAELFSRSSCLMYPVKDAIRVITLFAVPHRVTSGICRRPCTWVVHIIRAAHPLKSTLV